MSASQPQSIATQAAANLRHPLALALFTLTFTTGLIDATSYLGLDHVFTANMTGNVVLLGFGLAGTSGLPVVSPLVSLVAFLVGSGFGGLLASKLADRHRLHLGAALSIEALLTGVAAVFAAIATIHANAFSGDLVVAVLAFAMGVRNATVRRIAVPDLTTTVLTMTLTGLAADSRIFGGSGKGTARRTTAFALMLAGALVGALLIKTSLALPLAVAAVLAAGTCVAYTRVGSDPRTRLGGKPPPSSLG